MLLTNGNRQEHLSRLEMKPCTLKTKELHLDVSDATFNVLVTFLRHYKGARPPSVPIPLPSVNMKDLLKDKWMIRFLDCLFEQKAVFYETAQACHTYQIPSLFDLCCAKIGTQVKGKCLKEITTALSSQT